MATIPTINTIQKEECIGNSLITINNNYDNIRNTFTQLINNDLLVINQRLDALTSLTNGISSEQLAKAWVTFWGNTDINGRGAVTGGGGGSFSVQVPERRITNKYNVTNVIREATGVYKINFATYIGDLNRPAELVVIGTASPLPGPIASQNPPGTNTAVVNLDLREPYPEEGTSCRIIVKDVSGNAINPARVCVAVYSSLQPLDSFI
jgi:hypothetical protein